MIAREPIVWAVLVATSTAIGCLLEPMAGVVFFGVMLFAIVVVEIAYRRMS